MQSSESVTLTFDTLHANDTVYLGEVIEPLLNGLGMSRARLARNMQLDASIIGLWANSGRPVPHGRLYSLAEKLEVSVDFLLANGRVMTHNPTPKAHRAYVRPPMPAHEVVIPSAFQALPPPPIPPSQVALLWCISDHGCGVYRRHHHGPRPPWAPGLLGFVNEELRTLATI